MAEKDIKYKVTADTSEAVDSINQVTNAADGTTDALKSTEQQAKKTADALDEVGKEGKKAGKEVQDAGEAGEGAMVVLDEATGGLASRVKNVATGLKAMGKQAVTAFKGAVQGASAMGKALIATGIGAIVVALGLIVAYWDDIKGAVSGVSADQKKLLEDTQATADAQQQNLDAISASENSLKLAGKSEQEIRDMKRQQTDEVIATTELLLQQQKQQREAQIEAAERNQKITAGIIGFLTLPITTLLGAVDALTAGLQYLGVIDEATTLAEDFTMGAASFLFDPEEVAAEGDATVQETEKQLARLKNQRDGYLLQDQKDREDAANKRKEDAKKSAEELQKIEDEIRKREQENLLASIKDADERAKKAAEIQLEEAKIAIDRMEATEEQKNKLRLEAEKKYQHQVDAINEAARKKREEDDKKAAEELAAFKETMADAEVSTLQMQRERELELTAQYYDQLIADAEKYGLDTTALNEAKNAALAAQNAQYRAEDLENERQVLEAKAQIATDGLNLIADVVSSFAGDNEKAQKRAFKVQKGVNIATATIDTYLAATKVLSASAANPATILFPGYPALQAGLIIAAGLANVATIAKQQFQPAGDGGGGGDTGGGGGGPRPSKFANGGLLEGPSHSQGGIKTNLGELEGGEYVVNKESTKKNFELLEKINSMKVSPINMFDHERLKAVTGILREHDKGIMSGSKETPVMKTYVVASEVSSQQEADKRISDLARL